MMVVTRPKQRQASQHVLPADSGVALQGGENELIELLLLPTGADRLAPKGKLRLAVVAILDVTLSLVRQFEVDATQNCGYDLLLCGDEGRTHRVMGPSLVSVFRLQLGNRFLTLMVHVYPRFLVEELPRGLLHSGGKAPSDGSSTGFWRLLQKRWWEAKREEAARHHTGRPTKMGSYALRWCVIVRTNIVAFGSNAWRRIILIWRT